MTNTKLLINVPLFSQLPYAEVHRLASTLRVIDAVPGQVLFREGEQGDELFIVITGKLEVVKGAGLPDEKVLALLEQGDFVGEMSLLDSDGLRTATARAKERSQFWVVSRAEFDALLHRYPLLAYSMVQVVSKRLSLTNNSAFRDLQIKNFELQKAYNELKAAQAQIIEKERLERELQVARHIQMSILPARLPIVSGFDFGGQMEPARQVGGDFYDVIQLDEDHVALFVGDVADKGVPSAIFMARTHALLVAETSPGVTSEDVLRSVNGHLTRMERSDLFVTVLYGILDCKTSVFNFVRAGHEVPILTLSDGQTLRLPRSAGMALGMVDPVVLDVQSVSIPRGGHLLIYTDGLTDGRNPQGESFGLERVREFLTRQVGKTAQETCDALLQTMLEYRNTVPQDDDLTMVSIHAK